MKAPVFAYAAPDSIEEAYGLLAEDEDAKILAGGQSLMPLLALRLAAPSTLVDICKIPGLRDIDLVDGSLHLGSMVTHKAIEHSSTVRAAAPAIAQAASLIAHPQIRTRGTIGGAIAHADAAAEWPAVMLALDGRAEVAGPSGTRSIAADDLFQGPFMTSLDADEVITAVVLPVADRNIWVGEHQRRHGDYGLSILAMSWQVKDGAFTNVRLAVAGATGSVSRAPAAEAAMESRSPADCNAAITAMADELTFTSDIHGSADYRRDITATLFRKALEAAGERLTSA
ncbi:FAD binding domain-containing protein [Jatrophihabitans sp. YIM 134969]